MNAFQSAFLPFSTKLHKKTLVKLERLFLALENLASDRRTAVPTSVLNRIVENSYPLLCLLQKHGWVDSYIRGAKVFIIDEVSGEIVNGRDKVEAVLRRNEQELLRHAEENGVLTDLLRALTGYSELRDAVAPYFTDLEENNRLMDILEERNLRKKAYRYGRFLFKHNQRRWWALKKL